MKDKYPKKIILLDSHAVLHRAYHAMQGFSTKDGRPTGALYGFVSLVIEMCKVYKPHMVIACFDLPKPTFRHQVYEGYKDGRAKTDEALVWQLQEAKEICRKLMIPIYEEPGFEADDMLGTLAEHLKKIPDVQVIIASGDMDTLQLVEDDKVVVYTLKKGNSSVVYDEQGVRERFTFGPLQIPDYKGLAGDTSDNIIGIKGIGPKTATEVITKYGTIEGMYDAVHDGGVEVLTQAGFTPRVAGLIVEGEEEALFSKTLATIRRDAPATIEVPDKAYADILDKKSFEDVCMSYEFRSLASKVSLISNDVSSPEEQLEIPDDVTFKRIQVMTNLLHSEMTNPKIEDIRALTERTKLSDIEVWLATHLKQEGLWTLYEEVELPLMQIVAHMGEQGILLDTTPLKALSEKLHTRVAELLTQIYSLAGTEFNVSSPKQLGDVLYDTLGLGTKIKKTKTGARSTGVSELEKMKDEHPIIPFVMEYRELTKMLSTYIDSLPSFVRDDGRIHPQFIQTGAATGRFACTEPNVQNLPVKSEWGSDIRRAFVSAPGKILLSVDYAQIDLRSAAILSKDPHLVEIFMTGVDVHAGTAARMFKKDVADVTSTERRQAKAINFGILYGMGVSSLKDGLGVDRAEAQQYYDSYKETFSVLMEYMEYVKAETYRLGYSSTLLGRRREVPMIKSHIPFMRAAGERIAINAPMQGTSADILKLAMLDVDEWIKNEGYGDRVALCMQIHDELVYEVDEALCGEVQAQVIAICESVLSRRKLADLPLTVAAHVAHNLEK